MAIFLEPQEATLGEEIIYSGKTLVVDKHFSQGKDAKASNYEYFLNNPKGVYGLKPVEPEKPQGSDTSEVKPSGIAKSQKDALAAVGSSKPK